MGGWRSLRAAPLFLAALFCCAHETTPVVAAERPPAGWTAQNVELIGYTIMAGRPAFKITLTRAGDRWYIIGGHYNLPGWSVVDVTDPRNPHVVKFIPGPPNTSTKPRSCRRCR